MSETQKPYKIYKKVGFGQDANKFTLELKTIIPDEPLPHTIRDRITGLTGPAQPFEDTKAFSTHQEAKEYIKSLGDGMYIIIVDNE